MTKRNPINRGIIKVPRQRWKRNEKENRYGCGVVEQMVRSKFLKDAEMNGEEPSPGFGHPGKMNATGNGNGKHETPRAYKSAATTPGASPETQSWL